MSGLEHSLAPISLREQQAMSNAQNDSQLRTPRSFPSISGCVLISTCNRTELYLSCSEEVNPGELLCQAAGTEYAPYQDVVQVFSEFLQCW